MEFNLGLQKHLNGNRVFGDRVLTQVDGPQYTAQSSFTSICRCPEQTYWTPAFHSPKCTSNCKYCAQVRRRICMCLAAQTMGMGDVNHLDCICGPLCPCTCAGCTHNGDKRPFDSSTSGNRSQLGTQQYVAATMLQRPFYMKYPSTTPSTTTYNPRSELYETDPHREEWLNLRRETTTSRFREVLNWAPDEEYSTDLARRGTHCREAGCMNVIVAPAQSGQRRREKLHAFPYCDVHREESKHLPDYALCSSCGKEMDDMFKDNRQVCRQCKRNNSMDKS